MTQACEISRYIHEKTDTTKGKNAKVYITQESTVSKKERASYRTKKTGPSLIPQDTPIYPKEEQKKRPFVKKTKSVAPRRTK